MSKIITIFDGDALAFRASAVVDNRSVVVKSLKTGNTKEFKTRTEFKKYLELKGVDFDESNYEFTDKQTPEPLANVCHIMKSQITKINKNLMADEYLICLSGKQNFRDRLPLPSKYKGSREGLMRPVHLKDAKMYLWKNHPALLANDREADDDLIIKGYEYLKDGYIPILVSQDKDAFSATGLTLYDFTDENPELKLVPDFGSLKEVNQGKVKTIKGDGFIWLCMQLVNGDSADDYKPCELTGVKYGEKSAYKLLKDCKTKPEALLKVIEQYKKWYPTPVTYTDWAGKEHTKDYKDLLQLYFMCARMKQHENDNLIFADFCKEHGVELC